MRIDKFLKVSRLIKQRPRAKQLCDSGAVKVNNQQARAGRQICVGDEIQMISGNRQTVARVLMVPTGNVSKKDAADLIEIIDEKFLDETW